MSRNFSDAQNIRNLLESDPDAKTGDLYDL
jgi:hypothetical protein